MSRQALVLDANILVRAVLGQRVFKLLNQYYDTTAFFAPDEAFADAEKYLPPIFAARGSGLGRRCCGTEPVANAGAVYRI